MVWVSHTKQVFVLPCLGFVGGLAVCRGGRKKTFEKEKSNRKRVRKKETRLEKREKGKKENRVY